MTYSELFTELCRHKKPYSIHEYEVFNYIYHWPMILQTSILQLILVQYTIWTFLQTSVRSSHFSKAQYSLQCIVKHEASKDKKNISEFVFSFWSSLPKNSAKSYLIYYDESSHGYQVKGPIRRAVATKDFSFNSADYTLTIFLSYLKATIKDNIPSFQLTLSQQSKIRVIISKLALLGSST